ncbi:Pectinesterase inhibitor 6, partial [Mucuna pruriens]
WTHSSLAYAQTSRRCNKVRHETNNAFKLPSKLRMIIISRLTLLLAFIFLSFIANTGQLVFAKGRDNVRDACRVTRYPDFCVRSLAPFSNSAGKSPSKWARAGVSVTIGEVKNVKAYLANLKRHGRIRGRNRVALSDCVESFADALDELHKSLGVLRRLSRSTFGSQMGDLNTWISAALTNEDTCLNGFQGEKERKIKLLQNRVLKVYYITSNALALVNKLTTTGLGSISDP